MIRANVMLVRGTRRLLSLAIQGRRRLQRVFRGLRSQCLTRSFGDRKSWPDTTITITSSVFPSYLCFLALGFSYPYCWGQCPFFPLATIIWPLLKKNFQLFSFLQAWKFSMFSHLSIIVEPCVVLVLTAGAAESVSALTLHSCCERGWREPSVWL